MARVSIIIPTYNRASLLPQAIASALKAGSDVEVIVVDDASTDQTASVCRGLAGFEYVRLEQNAGLAQARNAGIMKSSGEFLAFLDDDDLRLAGSIDRQAALLVANETFGFVYGQVLIGDSKLCRPTGEIRPVRCPSGDLFWEFLRGNFIHVPSVLVRRRCLLEVGLFDPTMRATEDWDMWIRLAARYNTGGLDEPVAIYRDFSPSSGQLSSNRLKMCKASAITLNKALNSERGRDASEALRRQVWADYIDLLCGDLIVAGQRSLVNRQFRYAALNYLEALRLHPKRWRLRQVISSIVASSRLSPG